MSGVYGTPITESTLKAMPEYMDKDITQADMAKVARDRIVSENKKENVTKYVENLKKQYGDGISVLAIFYNATGDDITHHSDFNWHGRIGAKPYPQTVKNGQWGGFLHVKHGLATGSAAVVLYQGKNPAHDKCAWVVSWSNPYSGDNKVYTEVRELSHYDGDDWVGWVWDLTSKDSSTDPDWFGCMSTADIGSGTSPTLEATFTLTH